MVHSRMSGSIARGRGREAITLAAIVAAIAVGAGGAAAQGYGGQPSVIVDPSVLDALGGPPAAAAPSLPESTTPYGYGYVPGAPAPPRGGKLPPIVNPGVVPGGFEVVTPPVPAASRSPAPQAPSPIIPYPSSGAPTPIVPDVPVQAPLFADIPGYESPPGAPGGLVFQPPRGGPNPVLRGAAAGYGSPTQTAPTQTARGSSRRSAAVPPADGAPAVFRSTGTYATARRAATSAESAPSAAPASPAPSDDGRVDTPSPAADTDGRERTPATSDSDLTPPPPPPPLSGSDTPDTTPDRSPTLAAPRVDAPKVEEPASDESTGSTPTVAAPSAPPSPPPSETTPQIATAPTTTPEAPAPETATSDTPAPSPAPTDSTGTAAPASPESPPADAAGDEAPAKAGAPASETQVATATPPATSAPADTSALPSRDAPMRLLFPPDSPSLSDEAQQQLDGLARQLDDDADERVQLRAYAAGDADSASQTRRLSLARALAVRSYLIKQGIRGMRVDVRALGNTYQSGPGDRVDVLVLDQ